MEKYDLEVSTGAEEKTNNEEGDSDVDKTTKKSDGDGDNNDDDDTGVTADPDPSDDTEKNEEEDKATDTASPASPGIQLVYYTIGLSDYRDSTSLVHQTHKE